jgi:transcriptional regulator with XRE-family HTH domain
MTPEQCRAGRALLDWSQEDLAQRSQVAARTVRYFEKGERELIPGNIAALRRAFENAGVVFIDQNGGGPGVRLAKPMKRKRGK